MGTIVYMAPEVINDQGVNSAADVYSLGISTWEMFHRKMPFYEHDSLSRFSLCNSIINGTRPEIEVGMEEEMKNLILKSFQAYTLRPKASGFTTLADRLGRETNVSPTAQNAPKTPLVKSKSSLMTIVNNAKQYFAKRREPKHAQKAIVEGLTAPNRPLLWEIPLSSEIQNTNAYNSFDSKLTLLIGGERDDFDKHETILAFEHNTKTWKRLDALLPDFFRGAVVLDEELYAFGGERLYPSLFKLNPEKRSWNELCDIPRGGEGFMFFQTVAYRSKIYVAMRDYLDSTVFVYDSTANSWRSLAPIRSDMIFSGITVFNNKLYIFGRRQNSHMELAYYETEDDKWTYRSLDVPVKFLYTSLAAVTYQNELLFFDDPDFYASNHVERTSLKKLPRLESWRKHFAVFTCGNSLFVAGGRIERGRCSDEVESFDGMTWTEMPRMPYGLASTATVTATGDLAKQLLKWSR